MMLIYPVGFTLIGLGRIKKDLVPRDGLEPSYLAAGDFESPASTNFATWALEDKKGNSILRLVLL